MVRAMGELTLSVRGSCHWRFAARLAAAIVLVASVGVATAPPAALAQPPISITACGKITRAGLYEVDNNLTPPAAGDCLVVAGANVSLNLNHAQLIGAAAGAGVHVMRSAAKMVIEGNGATIESFGVGIQIDASGVLADNFTVISNSDAGVLLNRVQQVDLSNFFALNNRNDGVRITGGSGNVLQTPTISGSGRYGVWVQGSSRNSIGNFTVQNNVLAGIYLGCSNVGPQGLCRRGATSSNSNYLFSGTADIANSGVQRYGVAIDHGDNFNRVINVGAWQNDALDLFDVNLDCAANYWFAEPTIGQVAPQSCIN